MPTEASATSAPRRLARAFAALVAIERVSRAFEGLALAAACAWVLIGLAGLEGAAAARAALAPSAVAGLLAGASWTLERWRDRREIAARAERVLAAPQLLDTALGAQLAHAPGWGELLARRALARFDRPRLWLAAAPAWTATAALVLLAAGAHEWLVRCAPSAPAIAPLASAWGALAEELDPQVQPGATRAPGASAELAAELRLAAEREQHGELGAAEARELLGRARERLEQGSAPAAMPAPPSVGARASLAELGRAYGGLPAPTGAGSEPGSTAVRAPGSGSGVPSGAGEGTMGGSTVGVPARIPATAGATGGDAGGELRPTLSARWWPRDQDGLVEAWIARPPQTGSKR